MVAGWLKGWYLWYLWNLWYIWYLVGKILISLISLISGLRKGWWCVVGATGDWLINATTLPHLGKTVSVWKFYTGHDSGIGNVRVYGAKRDGKTNMIHGTPSRKDFQARIMARLARFLDPWLRVGICTYIFVGWVKMVMFEGGRLVWLMWLLFSTWNWLDFYPIIILRWNGSSLNTWYW